MTAVLFSDLLRVAATVPAPVAAPPVAATAPAALVIAAPAPAAAVATPAGVHRCWGDPGRLSGSGSGHRYWCGSDPCRGSSRHEQRCDARESDSRHGGLLGLAAPTLARRIPLTSVRPDLLPAQPVSGPARRQMTGESVGDLPLRSAAFGVICPWWGHVVAQRTEAATAGAFRRRSVAGLRGDDAVRVGHRDGWLGR